MSTVLIAGCGDVGIALGLRLASGGDRVLGLRRDVAALPVSIEGISADLSNPASLRELPPEIDKVVYAAAADRFDEAAYWRAYVDGLGHVLDALEAHPLERVLFCSSTGVYGQDDGGWVNEDSETRPEGFSGRTLLAAESILERWGQRRHVAVSSVRFGGIYGPGRTRLIDRVRAGARCNPSTWSNRIHRDDCAGAIAHLLGVASLDGCYVAVDDTPALACEVMDWLAEKLEVATPERDEGGTRARGGSKRCSNRRLIESGYRFRYPGYREGYADVLAGV